MATGRKKLSSAKAKTAQDGLEMLLSGTGHDARLSADDRALLERSALTCRTLEIKLRRDELCG